MVVEEDLLLRKLFCSGYEGVERHGGLQWVVVNVLVFGDWIFFNWFGG